MPNQSFPPPPAWWRSRFPQGSIPEWATQWALIRLGFEGQFETQVPFAGGRLARGGTLVDFFIPSLNLAIMVQGAYWHGAPENRVNDAIIKAQLSSMGITVIYIDADKVIRDPIFYVQEALRFRQHPL